MNNTIVPWQTLGIQLAGARTVEDAVRIGGLDYQVQKRPLRAIMKGRLQIEVPNHFATVRTDTHKVLGCVQGRYEIVDNFQGFSLLNEIVANGARFETCGIVDDGQKAWILCRLQKEMRIGRDGDVIRRYLLLVNSFDRTTAVVAKMVPIRLVCSNSLNAALSGEGSEFKVRHTMQAQSRLEEAHRLLRSADSVFDQLEFLFQRMSLKRITDQQLLNYVKQLIPDNPESESNTRTENQRTKILELYSSGIGAEINRGTLFSAYNSITEFVDHQETKEPARHLKSIWFGSGEQLKQKAFTLAEQMLTN